jgi:hypothetical protein
MPLPNQFDSRHLSSPAIAPGYGLQSKPAFRISDGSGNPVAEAIHATRQENPMPGHKLLRLAKFTTFLLLIALWTSAAPIDAQVEKGFDVDVHANDMLGWFSAKTYAETVAWSKIIVDKATDRILGAHFVRN